MKKYTSCQENRLTCSMVPYNTSRTKSIKDHIKIVHSKRLPGSKDYKCPKCTLSFKQQLQLTNHLKSVCDVTHVVKHRIEKKRVLTSKCGNFLLNQMKNCHKSNASMSFDCQKCGKTYLTKRGLKSHDTICGKPPAYQCAHCEYKGGKYGWLVAHIRTKHPEFYFNEVNLQCEHCKIKFRFQCLYDRHIRSTAKCTFMEFSKNKAMNTKK